MPRPTKSLKSLRVRAFVSAALALVCLGGLAAIAANCESWLNPNDDFATQVTGVMKFVVLGFALIIGTIQFALWSYSTRKTIRRLEATQPTARVVRQTK